MSAIVPVYNGERYLAEALRSIAAQEYTPVETIVVDDGSTDGSAAVARSFANVRLIRRPNGGDATARNAGVAAARGEFVAFLDADDLWLPEKLSVQIALHLAHPELGYSLTWQRFFLEPGVEPSPWYRERLRDAHPAYVPSALVARRDTFARLGGFDPHYRISGDSDWLFRAKDAGIPMLMLPQVLVLRRLHEANQSHNTAALRAELFAVVRRSISRQRGSGGQAGEGG